MTAVKLLEIPEVTIERALCQMLTSRSLLLEEIDGDALIFLPHLRKAKEGHRGEDQGTDSSADDLPAIYFEKAVTWCQRRTTLGNSILTILRARKVKCLLCAPTGRAAKRLTETTGLEAKTIHRLLEIDPGTGRFTRNESNPLACGLLVVDETSIPLVLSVASADRVEQFL